MAIKFNFDRLHRLYITTLESYDKAMAFDIQIGRGQFLFMMYLSDEDKDSKDNLFIYMRNTTLLQKIKMYGNHEKGTFEVYINDTLKNNFINELQLIAGNGDFDFNDFLIQLNQNIPLEVSHEASVQTMRRNRNLLPHDIVDDNDKTVLIGDKHLSVGTPQDKTLRKLYLYTNANPGHIDELIKLLKKFNRTVAWTTEDKRYQAVDINKMISSLSSQK